MSLTLMNRRALLVPGLTPVPPYDYAALESLEEFRSVADPANLIWAVDLSRANNQAIVFGERRLHEIILSGEAEPIKIVAFAIDFRTEQVEHLLAAIGSVKGHFEWNGMKYDGGGGKPTKLALAGWGVGKSGRGRS